MSSGCAMLAPARWVHNLLNVNAILRLLALGLHERGVLINFVERLRDASAATQSLVCVGLDPDPELMPVPDVLEFNKAIVDATKDLVCAYKPNLSFYEALGRGGLEALENTVSYIRSVAPITIVLGDAKRGDIGPSSAKYAEALFDAWGFDAATVNAYGGGESLQPFLEYKDRGVFVWCRSSNPGAKEFQDLNVSQDGGTAPFYEWMARRASAWDSNGNLGLVVGATYPDDLKLVRSHCPQMPILIPGVGAQGGDLEASVKLGVGSGEPDILISSSRGIIYASGDRKDFAQSARKATSDLRERINRYLAEEGKGW